MKTILKARKGSLETKKACILKFKFFCRWQQNAYEPAVKLVEELLSGTTPTQNPIPHSSEKLFGFDEKRRVFHCDVCNMDMKGTIQFEAHSKGRYSQSPL